MSGPASSDSSEVPVPSPCQAAASDTSSTTDASEKTIFCRVCLEDGSENLVAPCSCSGTLKWAHAACIQRWIDEKGDKCCEICRQSYSGDYSSPSNPPVAGPQVPLVAPFRGIMLPSPYQTLPEARTAAREEAAGGEEGAQTSAAWCLSAVLLFMSLVLLRQAFERPLGAKDSAPGPSSTPVGAMQPHSLGTSLVYSTLPADSLTSTLVHQDAPSQGEGGPALMWIALKVLMIVLPFCILLRIVVIAREVRMRHSRGAAAEQSRGAVLWNMEAGLQDVRQEPVQSQSAVQHQSEVQHPSEVQHQQRHAAHFLPFSVAVC